MKKESKIKKTRVVGKRKKRGKGKRGGNRGEEVGI